MDARSGGSSGLIGPGSGRGAGRVHAAAGRSRHACNRAGNCSYTGAVPTHRCLPSASITHAIGGYQDRYVTGGDADRAEPARVAFDVGRATTRHSSVRRGPANGQAVLSSFPVAQRCGTANRRWSVRSSCRPRFSTTVGSGRWDSNPRQPAWKAGALPLSYSRIGRSRPETRSDSAHHAPRGPSRAAWAGSRRPLYGACPYTSIYRPVGAATNLRSSGDRLRRSRHVWPPPKATRCPALY